jgi:hypothetical protein
LCLPSESKWSSPSFEAKPNWKIEEKKNSSGKLVGVILNGSLPPGESAQFNFTAKNPADSGKLYFRAVQIYEDGTKAEWLSDYRIGR